MQNGERSQCLAFLSSFVASNLKGKPLPRIDDVGDIVLGVQEVNEKRARGRPSKRTVETRVSEELPSKRSKASSAQGAVGSREGTFSSSSNHNDNKQPAQTVTYLGNLSQSMGARVGSLIYKARAALTKLKAITMSDLRIGYGLIVMWRDALMTYIMDFHLSAKSSLSRADVVAILMKTMQMSIMTSAFAATKDLFTFALDNAMLLELIYLLNVVTDKIQRLGPESMLVTSPSSLQELDRSSIYDASYIDQLSTFTTTDQSSQLLSFYVQLVRSRPANIVKAQSMIAESQQIASLPVLFGLPFFTGLKWNRSEHQQILARGEHLCRIHPFTNNEMLINFETYIDVLFSDTARLMMTQKEKQMKNVATVSWLPPSSSGLEAAKKSPEATTAAGTAAEESSARSTRTSKQEKVVTATATLNREGKTDAVPENPVRLTRQKIRAEKPVVEVEKPVITAEHEAEYQVRKGDDIKFSTIQNASSYTGCDNWGKEKLEMVAMQLETLWMELKDGTLRDAEHCYEKAWRFNALIPATAFTLRGKIHDVLRTRKSGLPPVSFVKCVSAESDDEGDHEEIVAEADDRNNSATTTSSASSDLSTQPAYLSPTVNASSSSAPCTISMANAAATVAPTATNIGQDEWGSEEITASFLDLPRPVLPVPVPVTAQTGSTQRHLNQSSDNNTNISGDSNSNSNINSNINSIHNGSNSTGSTRRHYLCALFPHWQPATTNAVQRVLELSPRTSDIGKVLCEVCLLENITFEVLQAAWAEYASYQRRAKDLASLRPSSSSSSSSSALRSPIPQTTLPVTVPSSSSLATVPSNKETSTSSTSVNAAAIALPTMVPAAVTPVPSSRTISESSSDPPAVSNTRTTAESKAESESAAIGIEIVRPDNSTMDADHLQQQRLSLGDVLRKLSETCGVSVALAMREVLAEASHVKQDKRFHEGICAKYNITRLQLLHAAKELHEWRMSLELQESRGDEDRQKSNQSASSSAPSPNTLDLAAERRPLSESTRMDVVEENVEEGQEEEEDYENALSVLASEPSPATHDATAPPFAADRVDNHSANHDDYDSNDNASSNSSNRLITLRLEDHVTRVVTRCRVKPHRTVHELLQGFRRYKTFADDHSLQIVYRDNDVLSLDTMVSEVGDMTNSDEVLSVRYQTLPSST